MGRTPKISNEAILDAARQVFWDQGMEASTANIAQKAGISEAAIFKRFATKQELFLAAIGIDSHPAWVKILEQGQPRADFKVELMEILRGMLSFYKDMTPRVVMMMAPLALLQSRQFVPPPIRDYHLLTTFLDRAIALGYIRDCDTRLIAHLIVGTIHHFTISQTLMTKHPKMTKPDAPELLEDMEFIKGFAGQVWLLISPNP
jgi:AcrR family transcriptional regulator